MKYIILLITIMFTSCGYKFIPESDYDVDNTSPYVIGLTWDVNNKFDISRKTNSSFDAILDVTDEEASAKGKNYNVGIDPEILVTFSENMYPESLFQYGVSESVVVIEGEPSRSLLSDISSPPLTDSNVSKILKVKVQMLSENNKRELLLDFSNADDCLTEDDFKTKFCKLKKDTNYSIVISKKVSNENGRELMLKKDDGKFIDDNFVLLFRTTGTPPIVVSTQPEDLEKDICLNLQEVKVNFSTEMDTSSITPESFYLSTNGNTVSDTALTVDKKSAVLKLNSLLNSNAEYKINIESKVRSKSRVNIEPVTFKFTAATSAVNEGPQFVQHPSVLVIGNSIKVSWSTDVKSLADIKYGRGTPDTEYLYNNYSTNHSITVDVTTGSGTYKISVMPKDRCGNKSTPEVVDATILNHPLISEVSANPTLSTDEFIEIFNNGETDIDLGDYTLLVGVDTITLPDVALPSKGYLVVADTNHQLAIDASAVIHLEDLDITKSEDVFIKYGTANVDSYTYNLSSKATATANLSAQRRDISIRNSPDENYCEASPTPGIVNSCE